MHRSRTTSSIPVAQTDLEHFHTTDGLLFNKSHEHGTLPGLSWASDDNGKEISTKIVNQAERNCWFILFLIKEWDEALLSQVRNFDFRYIRTDNLSYDWQQFLNEKLWKIDSLSGIIRTEPQTEVDLQLLEYMKSMVQPFGWHIRPATFPLQEGERARGEYFFLGYESKAVICWMNDWERPWFSSLNSDRPPSKDGMPTKQSLGLVVVVAMGKHEQRESGGGEYGRK